MVHLQDIHKYIFQDVYTWAGQTRNINLSKESVFCWFQHIESEQERIFTGLRKANYLIGFDKEQFSEAAAFYLGEINSLHPFREGNGRAQREFIRELALNAEWILDLETIPREKMIEASIEAHKCNYGVFEALIKERVLPVAANR